MCECIIGCCHNVWVSSVRRSKSVILVSYSRTTCTHSAPVTHGCVIPQNRKTLACWRTDFMRSPCLPPLSADWTIAAPHRALRAFLGSTFGVVVSERGKYITSAHELPNSRLPHRGTLECWKLIHASQMSVNRYYLILAVHINVTNATATTTVRPSDGLHQHAWWSLFF